MSMISSSSTSRWRTTMSSWVRSSAVPGVKPPPITNWNSPPAALNGFSNFPLQNILSLRTSIRILQGRRLNLIHIPIHLYAHFVQAILALVLPDPLGKRGVRTPNEEREYYRNRGKPQATDICNISVTSVECSIVCSTRQVERFFRPLVEMLSEEDKQAVSISEEEFVAIQVDGEGLDAGQRVLDLTSPLAMAGISIFFISTYFADYILVPSKSTNSVIHVLQTRGFAFEKYSETYSASHRRSSSTPSFHSVTPSHPSSPEVTTATTIHELESQTFTLLRSHGITPQFTAAQRLILVGERRCSRGAPSTDSFTLSLVKCLNAQPEFISLTLTDGEPTSLLLELEQLGYFDEESELLFGNRSNLLVPITLDLRGLPLESTGIVCGVAGRLVGGTGKEGRAVEMTYLSTARAGTVMVAEGELERAVKALTV